MPRGKKKIDESVKAPEENMTPETVGETAASEASAAETQAASEKKAVRSRAAGKTAENAEASVSKEKSVKAVRKRNKSIDSVTVQSGGNDYSMTDIIQLCKNAYRNGGKKQIKTINVYVKPENGVLRAYYVVNGKADGAFIEL